MDGYFRLLSRQLKSIVTFTILVTFLISGSVCFSQDTSVVGTTEAISSDTSILPEPLDASPKIKVVIQNDEEYTINELRDKVTKYTHMRTVGINLLSTGIPMLLGGLTMYISGIVVMANGDEAGIPLGMVGSVLIGFGPEFIAAGAVLSKIGGNKQREYERRLRVRVGGNSLSMLVDF